MLSLLSSLLSREFPKVVLEASGVVVHCENYSPGSRVFKAEKLWPILVPLSWSTTGSQDFLMKAGVRH